MVYSESITDRMLRLEYLQSILQYASSVYLCGSEENSGIFRNYIDDFVLERNIKLRGLHNIDLEKEYKFGSKDVIFILDQNLESCEVAITKMIKSGANPLQVITPTCYFFAALNEIRTYSDVQLPRLASIDIVNMCNIDCATCKKSNEHETADMMDFSLFVKILDKLELQGIRTVELYNFTEPFLHPDIYRFMAEVKKRGMTLGISTNLTHSNIKNLKDCVNLLTQGDWFVITVSGINQQVYEINHRKGRIANVIKNLQIIAQATTEAKKNVRLRLLKFDYNAGEYPAARKLADECGIGFEYMKADGNPFEDNYSGHGNREKIKKFTEQGLACNDYNKSFDREGYYCQFIHTHNIVINCYGNVELCCGYVTRPYDLGSFLDQDICVIQMKRDMHPICHTCPIKTQHRVNLPQRCQPVLINNVLMHGMKELCRERELAPNNFYEGIKGTDDYLKKVVEYFATR